MSLEMSSDWDTPNGMYSQGSQSAYRIQAKGDFQGVSSREEFCLSSVATQSAALLVSTEVDGGVFSGNLGAAQGRVRVLCVLILTVLYPRLGSASSWPR